MPKVPFSKPYTVGKELHYEAQAMTSGGIASDGSFTRRCAQLLEQHFGVRKVYITSSDSAALEMAAISCDLGPADEVILPSFTSPPTAYAVVCCCGARPVSAEVRPQTFHLNEKRDEAGANT